MPVKVILARIRSFQIQTMTACWIEIGPPEWGLLLGTPLSFDVGVCSVVIGVVLTMTFDLSED